MDGRGSKIVVWLRETRVCRVNKTVHITKYAANRYRRAHGPTTTVLDIDAVRVTSILIFF